eukprot:5214029-Amphidinium_carterae.1
MFGLTPVVRALCEHNLPDIVLRLRPLPPVDHQWFAYTPTSRTSIGSTTVSRRRSGSCICRSN